eukprot:103962_1
MNENEFETDSLSDQEDSENKRQTDNTNKLKDYQQSLNILSQKFDANQCNNSPTDCNALKRIVFALKMHQMNQNVNDIYVSLIQDYHHILHSHIKKFESLNVDIFALIYEEISKSVKCDIKKCKAYIRNNRDRNVKNDTGIDINTDILDTIHCYLLHSYDIGFRIRKHAKDTSNLEEELEYEDDSCWADFKLKQLKTYLTEKRKNIKNIRGIERFESNKFNTNIVVQSQQKIEEKSVDDNVNESNHCDYSFGEKYCYWKRSDNKSDTWYIESKYGNFKEE